MSSATSTSSVPPAARSAAEGGLQPWQFFLLAALGCATAITWVARGQGPTAIVLLSVLMGTAALIGYTTLRTVRPLVSPEDERAFVVGERMRAAIEREKLLTLRSIKELEFDRAMGRLSDDDFHEMSGRLRARAARLISQLDAGVGFRDQIEKDLAKRLGAAVATASGSAKPSAGGGAAAAAERVCTACQTANDHDARFCKGCGTALAR